MPARLAIAAIDLLLDAPPASQILLFTGGEPFLHFPLLRRAILHARGRHGPGKQLRIRVNTNGLLLTPSIVSFLDEQEVHVQLSFDGVAEAQRLRRGADFDRLDRLLRWLRARQPHFYRRGLAIAMSVAPETVPALAASVRYFLDMRVQEIRLGPVMQRRVARGVAPELADLLDAQFAEVVEDSIRHYDRTGETPLGLFRPQPDRDRDRPAGGAPHAGELLCRAGAGECLAIGPTGEASVCPVFLSAEFPDSGALAENRNRLLLGRLDSPTFRDRIASIARETTASGLFTRDGKHSSLGRCSACAFARGCGACPASIPFDAGNEDPERIPDFSCALFRAAARHSARYVERRAPRFSDGYREAFDSARVVRPVISGGPVRDRLLDQSAAGRGSKENDRGVTLPT